MTETVDKQSRVDFQIKLLLTFKAFKAEVFNRGSATPGAPRRYCKGVAKLLVD